MLEIILLVAWLIAAVISCATGAAVCGLIGFAVGVAVGWEKEKRASKAVAMLEGFRIFMDQVDDETIQRTMQPRRSNKEANG